MHRTTGRKRMLNGSFCLIPLGIFVWSFLSLSCGTARPEFKKSQTNGEGSVGIPSKEASNPTDTRGPGKSPASVPPAEMPPPVDSKTKPTDAPAPTRLAIRTVPNATERSSMSALYGLPSNQGGCAACHGALAQSEKKGRTAAQIQASATIINHRTPAAAKQWPTDIADSSDDGVDQAKLLASALAELLK